MAFHSLLVFIVSLNLAIGGSSTTRTKEEVHWLSVFPHTPMPKILQDILPRPGKSTVNNLEFGSYWDGDNSDKKSKIKNLPDNKGINDPEFGAYGYDDSYEKIKVRDHSKRKSNNKNSDNKGVNDPGFGDFGYQYTISKAEDNKEVNDPGFGDFGYQYTIQKAEDNSNNKRVNDPGFGDFGYQYTIQKAEDNSNNKGVNDPGFGDFGYQYTIQKAKDNSNNKGVNDPGFGDFGYQYTIQKADGNSDNESDMEDSPNNNGINDPEFGAYGYDDSYETFKVHDNSKKKFINKNFRGINDPGFGDFGYQYTIPKAKDNSDKGSNIEDSSTSKGVNNPKTDVAPNKKVNRKALRGHENTATKETIYFFQDTLLPGTKVNLPRLLQKSPMATFLPQQIAESLAPMSNDNLPDILKNFSLKAESKAAVYVQVAVKNCARDEMKGEAKYCAASLESFVDSGVSVLGKNIRLLWHELAEENQNPIFTIRRGIRRMGENNIVCHKMKYPYAVYLCHSIEKTEVYKVPLVSDDGTKANAMAACHKDTSAWNPNHLAFKILKVKPGTVPICHFFGRDTLVWIPN